MFMKIANAYEVSGGSIPETIKTYLSLCLSTYNTYVCCFPYIQCNLLLKDGKLTWCTSSTFY